MPLPVDAAYDVIEQYREYLVNWGEFKSMPRLAKRFSLPQIATHDEMICGDVIRLMDSMR